jgi:hypothetical protein
MGLSRVAARRRRAALWCQDPLRRLGTDHIDLGALQITLDGAALARLDEIFPGPGGAAPEAYAW